MIAVIILLNGKPIIGPNQKLTKVPSNPDRSALTLEGVLLNFPFSILSKPSFRHNKVPNSTWMKFQTGVRVGRR